MKTIAISIDEASLAAVDRLARAARRRPGGGGRPSRSEVIRQAVREFVARHRKREREENDRKVLVFVQDHPATGSDIWLLHMDGERREEPFVRTEFSEQNPGVSPDGQWLAYTSNESGRFEVYVQPFPAGGRKWLVSTQGGTAPLWARDGAKLFYRDGDKVLMVRVEADPTFSARRPEVLFEAAMLGFSGFGNPDYDVTVDGQRFLMIPRGTRQPRRHIHVVLNWFEELKQLVPSD
jgi:Arc/MetJ-type ribon-helix-helix transcriptional regulator